MVVNSNYLDIYVDNIYIVLKKKKDILIKNYFLYDNSPSLLRFLTLSKKASHMTLKYLATRL